MTARLIKLLVALALLAFLISLAVRPRAPVVRQLPVGTRVLVQAPNPLRAYRKALGAELLRDSLARGGLPAAQWVIRYLERPDPAVAFLVAGLRSVQIVSGSIPEGETSREFRLIGLDFAFQSVLRAVIERLPGAERDGDRYRVAGQTLRFAGGMVWIGQEASIAALEEVAAGTRTPVAAENDSAEFLVRNLDAMADLGLAVFSHRPILDGLAALGTGLNLSAFFDKAAFGGAGLNVLLHEKGLRAWGTVVDRPGTSFLRTCEELEGSFQLPARIEDAPARYLGLRVRRADTLGEAVVRGLFDRGPGTPGRDLIRGLFLRAFSTYLGRESAIVLPAGSNAAPLVAFQVADRVELERYRAALEKLAHEPGREPADAAPLPPGAFRAGSLVVHHRLTDELLVLGLSAEAVDGFLAAGAEPGRAPEWTASWTEEDLSGCLLGYADLAGSPLASRLAPGLAGRELHAALAARKEQGTTRLKLEIPFDNPIHPGGPRVLALARAAYFGALFLYLGLVVSLAWVAARNALAFLRPRKTPPPKEEE